MKSLFTNNFYGTTSRWIVALVVCGLITTTSLAQSLGVSVAGKEITNSNAKDIIKALGKGSGKMSYDPKTHTLTLENVTLDAGANNSIQSSSDLDEFTIVLIGENQLSHTRGTRMELAAKKNKITGTGSLKTVSPLGQGIYIDETELEISGGCTVFAEGTWGISGYDDTRGKLVVIGSKVYAKGEFGSICYLNELTLEDCKITSPTNAIIQKGNVLNADGNLCTSQVIIEKVTESYALSINGISVTAENADNILGNHTARYDAAVKTLFLNGVELSTTEHSAIEAQTDLIIDLSGKNKIDSKQKALVLNGSVLFRGMGELCVVSEEDAAISIKGERAEITAIGKISAKGKQGIVGIAEDNKKPKLIINESCVKAQGQEVSIGGFEAISLEKCHIHSPQEATIENGVVMLNGKKCTQEVHIDLITEYPLFIAGVAVNSTNYKDVFGDGTVKFDVEKKLLTLNNYRTKIDHSSAGIAAQRGLDGLTLVLEGDNSIETPYFGMIVSTPTIIQGKGSLLLRSTGSAGIVLHDSFATITEGPEVTVEGGVGILGFPGSPGSLILKSASLKVKGEENGSIAGLKNLTLDHCCITSPKDATIENGSVVLNGAVCKEEIVIQKDTGIANLVPESITITTQPGLLILRNTGNSCKTVIYNLTGEILYKEVLNEELSVPLPTGKYLVKIDNASQMVIIQ